jgi:phi13 family phage major tail protein
MARIAGVQYLGIAKIESYNENNLPVYGDVQEIRQFISFSSTKNFSEMNWYSNDIVEETFKNVVDIDVEIVLGKLSNEVKSLIMGSTYTEDGVMIEASNDAQQEFAVIVVLSQMGTVNGTLNYVFYRTKLTLEGVEAETKTDSITDSQLTLSGKAIPLANGRIASSIDSLDAKADSTVISNWTKSVYMPE